MTSEKLSSSEQKKKPLPKGLEQVSLQEYREQHKKSAELRKKKIQSSKATSKIVQIILIILVIPFVGLLIYWGICMVTPPSATP